jgi:hypothetical protein
MAAPSFLGSPRMGGPDKPGHDDWRRIYSDRARKVSQASMSPVS